MAETMTLAPRMRSERRTMHNQAEELCRRYSKSGCTGFSTALFPFLELQGLHAGTTFERVWEPPWTIGVK